MLGRPACHSQRQIGKLQIPTHIDAFVIRLDMSRTPGWTHYIAPLRLPDLRPTWTVRIRPWTMSPYWATGDQHCTRFTVCISYVHAAPRHTSLRLFLLFCLLGSSLQLELIRSFLCTNTLEIFTSGLHLPTRSSHVGSRGGTMGVVRRHSPCGSGPTVSENNQITNRNYVQGS